jgi:predicted AlkP superfamily phosphohydrolase/phosphomutase
MRTLILGFDAFDPTVFERLVRQGRMPHLAKYVDLGGYAHFSVANPPQSEVSWTSIATGLNPAEHGIFDFVHRNPKTYTPTVSLLPTKNGLAGTQFIPPHNANTIFDYAIRQGYPAKVLWWPATFPARPESPVQTLPGLGTPDILGKLGVGTLFTSYDGSSSEKGKTRIAVLRQEAKGRFSSVLKGPIRKKGSNSQESGVEIEIDLIDERLAQLRIGNQSLELALGEWSPILEVEFRLGILFKVHAITRVILTEISPQVRIYSLPLQIHPLKSPWRYATPQGFVKRTWHQCGPFLTIGWPQDTTALEEGCIDDGQFLDLCDSIFGTRETILLYHLQNFTEGIIASVFDSLDRIQHMFWRDRQDIIEAWYIKLDSMVGRVESALEKQGGNHTHIVIVSDHGFAAFDFKVHLNRWLIDKGYLTVEKSKSIGNLRGVDWSRSRAYAIGLNSIYLNLSGREREGIVEVEDVLSFTKKICNDLNSWMGPDGRPVVQQAYPRDQALIGSLSAYGPDILVGYSPGYRASQQTGLGEWVADILEPNVDHWGADHCIDPQSVPGVLFSNRGLRELSSPSYTDFPKLILGKDFISKSSSPPPDYGDKEDQEAVEERLRSLGYL